MKSGGPWNIKGLLRPEAREAAREAAHQSGVSVSEWLNNVIETNGEIDDDPGQPPDYGYAPAREQPRGRRSERHPPRDEDADDPYRNGADRRQPRHAGAPYRDEQPPYRDEPQPYRDEREDDPRPARNGHDRIAQASAPPRGKPGALRRAASNARAAEDYPERHDDRRERHDSSRDRREDHRDRAAERMHEFERTGADIAAVNDRLDRLTHQLERMGREKEVAPKAPAARARHARRRRIRPMLRMPQLTGAPMPPRRDFAPPRQPDRAFAVETPLVPERPAPVADVAIDQAVAEIAQRQRALDGDSAPAPAFANPAAAMPRPAVSFERRSAPRHEPSPPAKAT